MRFSKKVDLFSPNLAFPLAYVFYYTLGTTGILGLARDPSNLYMGTVQIYAIVGLLSYFLGQFLVQPWYKFSRTYFPARRSIKPFAKTFVLIGLLGLILILFVYRTIPLLDVTSRQSVSAFYSYLANFAWVGCLLLIVFEVSKPQNKRWYIKSIFYFVMAIGLLLLLAYRTPILLFSLILTIYLHRAGKIKTITILLLFLVFLSFGVFFWRYRYIQSYGYESLMQLVETTELPNSSIFQLLGMLYLGFFRTSIAAFQRLTELIPDQYIYFLGKASLASLYTILPGNQLSSRDLIAVLVTGRNPPPTSYTASLIGLPYMDFGIVGIIIFMATLGFISRYWYERSKSGDQFAIVMYSVITGIFILSIHTGLSDPLYYLFIPLMLYFAYKVNIRSLSINKPS
jgi:oligosaccharide repeat unit polymerase